MKSQLGLSYFCLVCFLSLLCDSLWQTVSCRIPFSGFLSHFHYCNSLSLWCVAVRAPLTPSCLSRTERVSAHLSSLPLTHSASAPERCSAPSCSLNGLQNQSTFNRVISEKKQRSAWLKLRGIELEHRFSYLAFSLARIFSPVEDAVCPERAAHSAHRCILSFEHTEGSTWGKVPISISLALRLACPLAISAPLLKTCIAHEDVLELTLLKWHISKDWS